MITYCVTFRSADEADRAAARLRSSGVRISQYRTADRGKEKEPGLLIGYPYSYPANTASWDYSISLSNGLPQTDGNAVIMALPFFDKPPARQVVARVTVSDADAQRARHLLVNSGGSEMRIVH